MNPFGRIYFLQNGDPQAFKVGFTVQDVSSRIRGLQTGSPSRLKECLPSMAGYKSQEGELHKRLEQFQKFDGGTEWFQFCDESRLIVELFRKNCAEQAPMPLFAWAYQDSDLFQKYKLGDRWTITQLDTPPQEFPGCYYKIDGPNGHAWVTPTIEAAERQRLLLQYMNKYGERGRDRIVTCWMPDDVSNFGLEER